MSKNKEELKPCPCGEKAIVALAGAGYYVSCEKAARGEPCFSIGHFKTRTEAITAWNTRIHTGCNISEQDRLYLIKYIYLRIQSKPNQSLSRILENLQKGNE